MRTKNAILEEVDGKGQRGGISESEGYIGNLVKSRSAVVVIKLHLFSCRQSKATGGDRLSISGVKPRRHSPAAKDEQSESELQS